MKNKALLMSILYIFLLVGFLVFGIVSLSTKVNAVPGNLNLNTGSGGITMSYATASASLAIGTYNAVAGPGNLVLSGRLGVGTSSPSTSYKLDLTGDTNLNGNVRLQGARSLIFEGGGQNEFTWVHSFNNNLRLDTSAVTGALSILESSGNVGVGTTSPGQKLHVYGSQPRLRVESSSASDALLNVKTTAGEWDLGEGRGVASHEFSIYDVTNSAKRFQIDSNGNVGIGTTGPGAKLNILGSSTYNDEHGSLTLNGSNGDNFYFGFDDTLNSAFISAVRSGIAWRNILIAPSGGNVGIGTTAPAQKLDVSGNIALTGNATSTKTITSGNFTAFTTTNALASYEASDGTNAGTILLGDSTNNNTWQIVNRPGSSSALHVYYFNGTSWSGNLLSLTTGGNLTVAGTITPTGGLSCTGCVSSANITNGVVAQADLKTTTASTSTTATSDTSLTFTGAGAYAFLPQGSRSGSGTCTSNGNYSAVGGSGLQDPRIVLLSSIGSNTCNVQVTYIQATPPYFIDNYLIKHFVYVLWDKTTGKNISVVESEDAPWEHNASNSQGSIHPFADYYGKSVPKNYEIAMIAPDDINMWRKEAKKIGVPLSGYLLMFFRVDPNNHSIPLSPITNKPIVMKAPVVWRHFIPQTKENLALAYKAVEDGKKLDEQGITGFSFNDKADYAEYYPASQFLEPGDIVFPKRAHEGQNVPPEKRNDLVLVRTTTNNDPRVIGVISTNPGQVLKVGGTDGQLPLALAGRVPVKVSTINGPIHIGDPITSSTIPGFGQASSRPGTIIGKALEDFDPKNGIGEKSACPEGSSNDVNCGKIIVFMNVSWSDPDAYLTSTGDYHLQQVDKDSYKVLNKDGVPVDRYGVFQEVKAATIDAGSVNSRKLTIEGDDVSKKLKNLELQIDELKKEMETMKQK